MKARRRARSDSFRCGSVRPSWIARVYVNPCGGANRNDSPPRRTHLPDRLSQGAMTPTTVAEKRGAPWWHIASLACVLSAVLLPFAVRALVGPPGARVHVRWQRSIDADTRRTLETRFRLSDGTPLGDTTWGYDLL